MHRLDLEAPGLRLYFKNWLEAKPGLAELIQSHLDGPPPDWRSYASAVNLPDLKGRLSLMLAGQQDATYVERVQNLNWPQLYAEHGFGQTLEAWRDEWKGEYDFVLVDSRTGITDVGGICAVQLPDIIVLFCTPNEQSLEGIVDFTNRAIAQRAKLPLDRTKLLVLPVITRLEARVEYERAETWLQRLEAAFQPYYRDWAHRDVFLPTSSSTRVFPTCRTGALVRSLPSSPRYLRPRGSWVLDGNHSCFSREKAGRHRHAC